jgi:hypothetical protein
MYVRSFSAVEVMMLGGMGRYTYATSEKARIWKTAIRLVSRHL